ncbi:MAG: hypothetical protein LM589_04475 [Thermosphaera sp.]|nr:hypothetical protein [Thermosphaera sp.]
MDFKIDYFYGLYPSSVYGNLILVDPLLPPRKCPLKCISCPLPGVLDEDKYLPKEGLLVSINEVLDNIESLFPETNEIDGLLLWGFGDPMLLGNLGDFILALKTLLARLGVGRKILIHTSLVSLHRECTIGLNNPICSNYKKLIDYVDVVITPFLWYVVDKQAFGWPKGLNLSSYLETIKSIQAEKQGKIVLEIHVFRLHDELFPSPAYLDELLVHLKYLELKEVILKPIDRPTRGSRVKQPSRSQVERISEYLSNEGFRVLVEYFSKPPVATWRNTARVLYNQLIRFPLRYSEVKLLYGDLGVIALDNLVSRNLAVKVTWGGEVFYAGVPKI